MLQLFPPCCVSREGHDYIERWGEKEERRRNRRIGTDRSNIYCPFGKR